MDKNVANFQVVVREAFLQNVVCLDYNNGTSIFLKHRPNLEYFKLRVVYTLGRFVRPVDFNGMSNVISG